MRYFATYLIYVAVLARALGWSQDSFPIPRPVWVLLVIFGLILFTEQPLSRRLPWYPRLYTLFQSALVTAMLYIAPSVDIFPMLFYPLSFQAVKFFGRRIGFLCIAGFTLAMAGMFIFGLEWQSGLTMVLAGGAANVLMGSFAHLISRTDQRRQENQRLLGDLKEAYHQMKNSAAQAEALAAAEERHRLVRELHDSLTQTLFSMTLAGEAALLAVQEAPHQVEDHLARLQILSRSAVREVQSLTGQIPSQPVSQEGLATAIRRLADERMVQDGLQVTLEVTGKRELPKPVEIALYRIAQEALNNVVRHAGTHQAHVRLCLEDALASLEIEDAGSGFIVERPKRSGGLGLVGMAERASEIGWELQVNSHPGRGTRIHVEEKMA